jgi:hypothetical protein
VVQGEAHLRLASVTSTITLRQRSNFAVQHLMAAARFSKMCGEIEDRNKGLPLGDFFTDEISCVSATVLLATASLDAYINEVWADGEQAFPGLDENVRVQFMELTEGRPVLEKFQRTLRLKGHAPLPEAKQPFEDAQALIRLRNALVHFKPEWHDRQTKHKDIEGLLKGKFALNPSIGETAVFFPQRCMSHGCTVWVIRTVQLFVDAFCTQAQLENKYLKFRDRLEADYRSGA